MIKSPKVLCRVLCLGVQVMINPAKVVAALGLASITGLAAANADEGPTLQKIKTSAAITIGYQDAAIPFSYAGAGPEPIGFSLDLCAFITEKVSGTAAALRDQDRLQSQSFLRTGRRL